jgi:surface protein
MKQSLQFNFINKSGIFLAKRAFQPPCRRKYTNNLLGSFKSIGLVLFFVFLLVGFGNNAKAQITASEPCNYIQETDTWTKTGTVGTRNTYTSNLIAGVPARVIWSSLNSQWEIQVDIEVDGFGDADDEVWFSNNYAATPNPPDLATGFWIDHGFAGCGSLTKFEGLFTQNVLSIVTDVYVNALASPGGDGTSWATAYNSVQTGIDNVDAGGNVHIKAGYYYEDIIVNNNVTFLNDGAVVFDDNSFGDLTIAASRSLTIASPNFTFGAVTINGMFNVQNDIKVTRDWSNNGTYIANTSNIEFCGIVQQDINGTTVSNFNNVTLNNSSATLLVYTPGFTAKDFTLTSAQNIMGTIQITGDFVNNSGNPSFPYFVLKFAKNGTQLFTGTTSATSLAGIEILPGSTLSLQKNISVVSWRNDGIFTHGNKNVTFIGGSSTIQGASLNTFYDIDINKSAAASLTLSSDITVVHNWNLILGSLNANGKKVTFSGSTAQTISGETTFSGLEINNVSGNVTLLNNQTVSNDLTFTNGKLILGTSNLTVLGNITGFDAIRFIVAEGTGVLKQNVAALDKVFPIGTSAAYTPVTLSNIGTIDIFSVNVKSATTVGSFSPALSASITQFVPYQWNISEDVVGGSNVTATFLSGTNISGYTNPTIARHNGTAWQTTTASRPTNFSASASAFTEFSPFAVYNVPPCLAPTAPATAMTFGTTTSSSIQINGFTAPSGGATGYAVYINNVNSFTAPANGTEPVAYLSWNNAGQQPIYFGTLATPNVTVTGLTAGTTYYYKVYAYNNCSGTETFETTGLTGSATTPNPMTLIFNTNLAPGNRTVTLPLNGTVNVTVDWGDGTAPENFTTSGNKDHIYLAEGTYTVTITGSLTEFGATNYPNVNKLLRVTSFGDLGLTNLSNAFGNATNLIEAPTLLPATVTDLSSAFYNCTNFNFNISTWNVSNVTNMAYLFCNASSFNQNIGGWNVSNVTTMMSTFYGASAFNQNIGAWNVSSVTDMWAMFCYATSFNQNIGNWTVTNLLSTSSMFYGATAFNQNISSWNVGNVTDMSMMFLNAISFNQNISGWNVGNVTDMTDMFFEVSLSTANYDALLIGWAAKTLKPNVNFSGGNSKYSCVAGANAHAILTNAPNGWIITDGGSEDVTPTAQATAMTFGTTTTNSIVFNGYTAPVSTANGYAVYVNNVNTFTAPVNGTEPVADLSWNNAGQQPIYFGTSVSPNVTVTGLTAGTTYYYKVYAYNNCSGTETFETTGLTGSATTANPMTLIFNTNLAPGNRTVTLPLNGTVNVTVDWGDGTAPENFTTSGNKDHIYLAEGTYTINISGSLTWFGRSNYPNANKLHRVTSFGDLGLTDLSYAFHNASNLIEAPTVLPATVTNLLATFYHATSFNFDISTWNVSNVTNMEQMFAYASAFNIDIHTWDVGNVTNMKELFRDATNFNKNIGNWNVSKVTNMSMMFAAATNFNQNLNTWNVGLVTNMSSMFSNASSFNESIKDWNVSNVTNMSYMFRGASIFNTDITNWNVGNVTSMSVMFHSAYQFNQNISNWNVGNVTNMYFMFGFANQFNQNIGNWNVSKVTDMGGMFYYAISFNQNIGNWNVGLVTDMSNMFGGITLSTANYDALLIGWAAKTLKPNVNFRGGDSKYSCDNGAAARAILTGTYNWIIADGGSIDISNPVITSTHINQTLNANASCQASLPSYTASLTATDNCTASGSIVKTQSPIAGTTVSGATNTITLRATDATGNFVETTFNVAVVDNTNPVITSTHNNQTVNANASCQASLSSYTASLTATDNCTASWSIVKTQSPIAGTTISGATNTITLRATDATGNFVETTFNVAVVDNTNPVITSTHNNQTINANASCQSSLPSYTASVTATDNCTASGSIVITQSPAAGTTISGATNTITLRATDATGNFVETSFNVAVTDNTNPTVITQNITVSLDETGNAAITADQINNGSSDNCSIASMSVSPNTFTCANTDDNTVTLTVFDASGNSASATATVTVQDLELPQLLLPANKETLVDVGLLTAIVTYDAPIGSDNCSVASIVQTAGLPSGSAFPLGVTVNTFRITDVSGNIYSQSFEVKVVQEESMVIAVYSPQTSSCGGDLINLSYNVLSGIPVQYRIVFSQEAKNAGFVDMPYSAITETISFASPALVTGGNYQGQIQFRNSTGAESELYSFNFTMNLSSNYIVAKFNDVVLCDNQENRFVSYQWYKNGVVIDGATDQFYNDPNGLSGVYTVAAVTTDGKTIFTCDKYFNLTSVKKVELLVYPNPANINNNFVVKVANLNSEDLTGAVMLIYNSKGSLFYSTKKVDSENYVNLPLGGEYFGVIKTLKGNSYTYKVIVVK